MLKPLYCPHPLLLSPEELTRASQVHWSILAKECEEVLREYLSVPSGVSVLMVDKCTHALTEAMAHLKVRLGVGTARIPRSTYRATCDAARMAGLKIELVDRVDDINTFDEHAVNVPVTLGGSAVWWRWLEQENVVVDAAHTGYRDMFASAHNWRALVCLSFFPTKPLGAFGGGAIIGPEQVVEHIRQQTGPFNPWIQSTFTYPQGIQSIGLMHRLRSPCTWMDHMHWKLNANSIQDILQPHGFSLRWGFQVPHVLSFTHKDPQEVARLRDVVQAAGYETGKHYAPLDTPRPSDVWVALPFIYPELVDVLEKKYGQS